MCQAHHNSLVLFLYNQHNLETMLHNQIKVSAKSTTQYSTSFAWSVPKQVCYTMPCAQLSTRLINMAVTFVLDRLPVLTSTSRKKMSLVLTLKSNSFAQYFTWLPLQHLLNNKQFYTCFTQLKQQCEQSIMRTIQQIVTNATIQCNKICH